MAPGLWEKIQFYPNKVLSVYWLHMETHNKEEEGTKLVHLKNIDYINEQTLTHFKNFLCLSHKYKQSRKPKSCLRTRATTTRKNMT